MHIFSSGKIQVFIQVGGYLLVGVGRVKGDGGRRWWEGVGGSLLSPPISGQLSLLTCSTQPTLQH